MRDVRRNAFPARARCSQSLALPESEGRRSPTSVAVCDVSERLFNRTLGGEGDGHFRRRTIGLDAR